MCPSLLGKNSLSGLFSLDLDPLLDYGGGLIGGELEVLGGLDPLECFLKGIDPLLL